MNGAHPTDLIRLFLCGDVMTGRGIDQILRHPSAPGLHEPYVRDARHYLQLAEAAHGPIPRPVDGKYIWGDALAEMRRARTAVRIINLETSVTRSNAYWPDKEIHYRMHPDNMGCLKAAAIDCCCLANNHVLDWGYQGLEETLRTLDGAGVAHAGAGANAAAAAAPAILTLAGTETPGKHNRILVFAFGSTSSGIPDEWAAASDRPGVNLLPDLSATTARRVGDLLRQFQRPGDVTIVSIHWGDNWGYQVPAEQIQFAHLLAEEGTAIVHGHSAHHVKACEIHQGCLILYGCGDFLNDYEGIGRQEWFRSDLTLMYLVQVDPRESRVTEVRLIPMQVRQFQLHRASETDARWLGDLLNREGAPFGARVHLDWSHHLILQVP